MSNIVNVEGLTQAAQCLVEDMTMGLDGQIVFDDDSWQAALENAEKIDRALPLVVDLLHEVKDFAEKNGHSFPSLAKFSLAV